MKNEDKRPPLDRYDDEYPAMLENEREIADYYASIVANPGDGINFDETRFLNRFHGYRAVLRLIPSDDLSEGWEGDNLRFPERERRYEKSIR